MTVQRNGDLLSESGHVFSSNRSEVLVAGKIRLENGYRVSTKWCQLQRVIIKIRDHIRKIS